MKPEGSIMEYVWLSIVLLLSIIEVITVGLTTIWFIISGLIALILSILLDNILLEMAVFVLGGTILLFTTRPIVLKYIKPKSIPLNIDRIIGMEGIAQEDITPTSGEVKVDGKVWTAFSNQKILKNEKVRILEIQSTKLKVEKVEE